MRGEDDSRSVSVASINTFLYCPRKLYLEKRLGLAKQEEFERKTSDERVYLTSRRMRLRGMVDEVDDKDNEVLAIHNKSGKAPKEGVWKGHRLQMGAYLLLLEEMHGERQIQGIIRYGEEERDVTLNPYLRYEVLDIRDRILTTLDKGQPPEHCKRENRCKACPLLNECYDEHRMHSLLESRRD